MNKVKTANMNLSWQWLPVRKKPNISLIIINEGQRMMVKILL